MPADGGPVRRVDVPRGDEARLLGWTPDGAWILFASDAGQPFERVGVVHAVRPAGGLPVRWPVGPAVSMSVADGNRYGARTQQRRPGAMEALPRRPGRRPCGSTRRAPANFGVSSWLDGKRRAADVEWASGSSFVSDHEGIGNLYSVLPSV
jgi:tricorn protease